MDPRQRGLFAAAWNVGLVAAMAKGGLDSVALGAVTGPQGSIYRKASYKQPGFDGSKAVVYPTYHVLAGLAPASGKKRIDVQSSPPSILAALAHRSEDGPELWLANLTSEPQKAKVSGFSGAARMHRLSDSNFQTIITKPDYLSTAGEALKKVSSIELGPYGVVRIRTA
jgi:D-apionolactonase